MTPPLLPFASPDRHAAIADIIRRHSSNPADIRQMEFAGLDWAAIHEVLDLGCGFGLPAGLLARQSVPGTRIMGVDACAENGDPFLAAVHAAGRHGAFECLCLDWTLPWPDRRFDLVVAAYSLYYFVDLLPEIARVLSQSGTFVTVTHSETTFCLLCEAAGLDASSSPLRRLLRGFCAENGADRLAPFFADIERIEYPNTLRFEPEHLSELLDYADFKLPLLAADGGVSEAARTGVRQRLTALLRGGGVFEMDKNDVIFRCRRPRAL